MLRTSKPFRRDYPAMFAVVMMLLGIVLVGGIAYSYNHRPSKVLDEATHLLERHKPPVHP
jgi:hypothetical protein